MKTRRDSWLRTHVHRGQLVKASPPQGDLSRGFLRDLSDLDKDLELHWHPIGQRWVLYRRVSRSAGRSSNDLLIKECVVRGPNGEYRRPGGWLLERLRFWDKTKGGSVDPERADYLYRQKILREAEEEEQKEDKERLKLSESLAEDIRFCAFGRASIVSDWEPER